jgi:Leucine-rich repeat (LRR) protein
MPFPKEPITKQRIFRAARLLLDCLAGMYLERALSLGGEPRGLALPDVIIEAAFTGWDEVLREAPARLLEANVVRAAVEEAIAESQLRMTERYGPRLGSERTVEMLRGFGQAVDRARFASPRGLRFRAWLPGAMPLPGIPESGPTPDDERLRARIDALTDDERATTTEILLHHTEMLRDLGPLGRLPSLKKLQIRSAPLLTDLSPLATFTGLEELEVDGASLRDLSPLVGLTGLRRLRVHTDEGLDLAPLRALVGLEDVSLGGCSDLAPLLDLPSLKALSVSGQNTAPDLEPIRALVGLRDLNLFGFEVDPSDIVRPLRSLTHLKLHGCKALSGLGALEHLTELEELDLAMNPVTDLVPLRFLTKLRVLNLFGTAIRSWPPLRDLPCLEDLNVMCTSLPGFAGIEHGTSLRQLVAGPSDTRAYADLKPLAGLVKLERLHLDSLEHMSDLSPLAGLIRLQVLDAADSAVRDLTPLAGLTALENLMVARTAIETVEPLAGLPNLRILSVSGCEALRSLRPLAACPALVKIECDDCDALKGPTSVEQLHAAPPVAQPMKRFPSAGATPTRPGAVATFDARAHLPKRPPEGWSLPEREHDDDGVFWIEAEHSARVVMSSLERDGGHLLMVHVWRHDRTRMSDKQAARILRRFRAADSFVESTETLVNDVPDVRCFVARAHSAAPDTWGAHRAKGPPLHVEASEADDDASAGVEGAASDVRHHLPSPLPAGWSTRATTKAEPDVACRRPRPS